MLATQVILLDLIATPCNKLPLSHDVRKCRYQVEEHGQSMYGQSKISLLVNSLS